MPGMEAGSLPTGVLPPPTSIKTSDGGIAWSPRKGKVTLEVTQGSFPHPNGLFWLVIGPIYPIPCL